MLKGILALIITAFVAYCVGLATHPAIGLIGFVVVGLPVNFLLTLKGRKIHAERNWLRDVERNFAHRDLRGVAAYDAYMTEDGDFDFNNGHFREPYPEHRGR